MERGIKGYRLLVAHRVILECITPMDRSLIHYDHCLVRCRLIGFTGFIEFINHHNDNIASDFSLEDIKVLKGASKCWED